LPYAHGEGQDERTARQRQRRIPRHRPEIPTATAPPPRCNCRSFANGI
jgi:hypothetical protein